MDTEVAIRLRVFNCNQAQPLDCMSSTATAYLLAFVESVEMFRTHMFTDYMPIHGASVLPV